MVNENQFLDEKGKGEREGKGEDGKRTLLKNGEIPTGEKPNIFKRGPTPGGIMLKNIRLERPLAVIDLETTGIDTKIDRIIEISVLKLAPGGDVDHRTRRVNPGVPIPPEATAIHGITDDDVAEMPSFRGIAPSLTKFLDGCDLAGFNVLNYDLKLLVAEYNRVGLGFSVAGRKVIDTCRIYHQREPRDLTAAFRFYCGLDHEGAHGAAADVLATAAILDAQVARYRDLPRTVEGLHGHCNDPDAMDMGGMFGKDEDGAIVLIRGKYKGRSLNEIARAKPDYLEWMQREDFFDDTKRIALEALKQAS
ncbi:DNA polymerase III epsilon subunit-like 3'-5' exonuclease [Singulisphaera acidiphila DSM 18658]|uniref:DNA polymerase III epsilon subunit-like 3'-5' exonuclease n=2 Tax=Singulisphaera acidiphila TaxID=466153 RepID=L0DDB3_SINAD|nr:DNA polymerase III epsilon subunit-like 3'-5' exonuclease [Singulisphaera acidiphila DSM 18658]